MYPANDDQFEEHELSKVEPQSGGGWAIGYDSWMMYCPPTMDDGGVITPAIGQTARYYGRGLGARVRGLFVDGRKIFYRTEAEDKEHGEIELYGRDAADWLSRWDAGHGVWSIEMGGLGPGYEQCIHITCAEILRWFIEQKADAGLWDDQEVARPIFNRMEGDVSKLPPIKCLGLSGAQWGAAQSLAARLYRQGPRAIMADAQVKDRHIQVCRNFPQG